jgi:hypothetical protein
MDAYEKMERVARAKRDDAIKAARNEYNRTVYNIRLLARVEDEDDPTPRPTSRQTLASLILNAVPEDDPFTTNEMYATLRKLHPDRRPNLHSVRLAHHNLAKAGKLRRIGKNAEGQVLWALESSNLIEGPWGVMDLPEAIESILGEGGPKFAAEIAVLLHDRGYRPHLQLRVLYNTLNQTLRRCYQRFRQDAEGRWGLVSGD